MRSQTGHSVLECFDFIRTFSKERFEWDPNKSTANESKHGISLEIAAELWEGPVVSIPSIRPGEERHLAIGLIGGNYWTVIYAPRGELLRLISARRPRDNEEALHKNYFPNS